MTEKINQYIEKLKSLSRTKSDADLAAKIGVAKQTISSWRRRGSVPLRVQHMLTDLYGPEAAYSDELGHAAGRREQIVIWATLLEIYDKNRTDVDSAFGEHDHEKYTLWAEAFLHLEGEVREFIRRHGFFRGDSEDELIGMEPHQMARLIATLFEKRKFSEIMTAFREADANDGED